MELFSKRISIFSEIKTYPLVDSFKKDDVKELENDWQVKLIKESK